MRLKTQIAIAIGKRRVAQYFWVQISFHSLYYYTFCHKSNKSFLDKHETQAEIFHEKSGRKASEKFEVFNCAVHVSSPVTAGVPWT